MLPSNGSPTARPRARRKAPRSSARKARLAVLMAVVLTGPAGVVYAVTDTDAPTTSAVDPERPAIAMAAYDVVDGERIKPDLAEQARMRKAEQKRLAAAAEKAVEKRLGLVAPSVGRSGTGLALGVMDVVDAPVSSAPAGVVSTSVANIPNRTSAGGFASAIGALTGEGQDFVVLNEVSNRDLDTLRALAPAYDAYRDPVVDGSPGGQQSMNNVVMWRAKPWNLIDAGRVKVIDDDRGYLAGSKTAFLMDRYLTWTVMQRQKTGAILSVVSLHMPTNPAKYPRQPGAQSPTRVERFSGGMDRVLAVVRALSVHGPVLLGGDMNSHLSQGAWTAPAKMRTLGYSFVKDQGVMYLFHQPGASVLAHRQISVASDHPAIISTLDLSGVGPTP